MVISQCPAQNAGTSLPTAVENYVRGSQFVTDFAAPSSRAHTPHRRSVESNKNGRALLYTVIVTMRVCVHGVCRDRR